MKLSKYFSKSEMQCRGKSCCGGVYAMNPKFLEKLDKLREKLGPLVVTSGFRCPTHNRNVGGSTRSKHRLGIAADLKYHDLGKLVKEATDLGLYTIRYDTFVHVDDRFASTYK